MSYYKANSINRCRTIKQLRNNYKSPENKVSVREKCLIQISTNPNIHSFKGLYIVKQMLYSQRGYHLCVGTKEFRQARTMKV